MSQPTESPDSGRTGVEDVQQLLARAERGDPAVLDLLRTFLDQHPEVWQHAGDLAKHAELALVNVVAGHNLLVKESISRKLGELKKELEPASPLERLLAERVALAWLQVHHADLDAVAALAGGNGTGPRSVHAQRRLGQAHVRYLQSIKALATLRKLLKPTLSPLDLACRPVDETSSPRQGVGRDRHPLPEGVAVTN